MGLTTLKQLEYFYSSFPALISNQLLDPRFYRKIQRNDAIWEILFCFDTISSMISKKSLLIDESKYPELAQIRLPSQSHDCNQTTFPNNFSMDLADGLFSSSEHILWNSPKSSWKTVLAGGLTHTITKSIPPSTSLQHLFPIPGSRYPRIRIYYIFRKIIRWRKDSSHHEPTQSSLPKLEALMSHSITRHHLHDAIVEWYETLEPEWRLVPHLSDWLKYSRDQHDPMPFRGNLAFENCVLSMLMWCAFSLIHVNSNDDVELFSMPIVEQGSSSRFSTNTSSSSSHFFPTFNPEIVSEPVFEGASATWCILSFRSLVRLISELSVHGEHPSIYGLTVAHFLYQSMTSLLIEQPNNPRVNEFIDQNECLRYSQSHAKSELSTSIVKGITAEEIIHSVQYQIIPFVTEIANIWPKMSIWIDSMHQFIERIKRIN